MDTAAESTPGPTTDTGPADVGSAGRRRLSDRAAALRRPVLDPYWLALGLFAAYATLSVCRYRRMETMSWDLGIFEQAIRGYAQLKAPVADLKGPGANILGDHFSPVTALLAPLYRLFPGPVTLLVAQAALFALSAIPVTRIAARLLGRGRGLLIGVAYGFSWGVQRAVDFDFHEICFAVPLLAFALEAVLAERWLRAALWAAPLVLVKEDMGATVAAIGTIMLIRTWRLRDSRVSLTAIGLIGFGVIAAAVALGVIIPAFNSGGSYDYWQKMDSGTTTATIPLDTALRTLAWVLLPTTGLLALRSPLLLAALPTLGWRFVSHDDHYWGTDWHYNAVLMPVVFLALVDACDRSRRSPRAWLSGYARQLPVAVAGAALALSSSLPLYGLTVPDTYRKPDSVRAAEHLLATIPDGASVEANVPPISRLAHRCRVFWVGDTRGITPDYLAFHEDPPRTPQDMADYARQLHPDAEYQYMGTAGGVYLLKLKGSR
ncbi:DUF2079 domain-containing protein [Streptomyces palmae]|uniref:DUF2079 domain-containing protein n=1 Tax=Streptomyces palmae TaxID=1701085 RepID=A0A4Z0FUI7_9ACTN|nr:DUF2079 domain-containing protein [Streptomyces palmae]TGA86703.1 DUF2079 domain-containing protein [Streptomyces palmae]